MSSLLFKVPEYEVEADDGLWLRRLAVVDDSRLGLRPDEAAAVHQETVVAGADLTFAQHYRVWTDRNKIGEKGWS